LVRFVSFRSPYQLIAQSITPDGLPLTVMAGLGPAIHEKENS